jgi:ADP-ribosyl-[dinitrogen reductase] hydrolase
VMRVAPVGLLDVSDPFRLAAEAAAVTHGHPSGYLSAGALGVMVAALCARGSLDEAVDAALTRLADEDGHEEVSGALERACHAARHAPATPESVERLGGGWVAEEALGIAVFCALKAQDFASGVLLAVNHSGDSDSTGSITGNLLGAALGERAIPDHWLGRLNARAIVETAADDLVAVQGPGSDDAHNDLAARYPPF